MTPPCLAVCSFVRADLLALPDAALRRRVVVYVAFEGVAALIQLVAFLDGSLARSDPRIQTKVQVAGSLSLVMLVRAHCGNLLATPTSRPARGSGPADIPP